MCPTFPGGDRRDLDIILVLFDASECSVLRMARPFSVSNGQWTATSAASCGTDIWKNAGYGTIVYLATIAGIDPGLYEAATIDGAGHWRRAWHITLAGLRPVIVILFILRIGKVLDIFKQVFVLATPIVRTPSDVLMTYAYRTGIQDMQVGYAMACLFHGGHRPVPHPAHQLAVEAHQGRGGVLAMKTGMGRRIFCIGNYAFMGLYALVMVIPVLYILQLTLSSHPDPSFRLWPRQFTLDNTATPSSTDDLAPVNSVYLSVVSTCFSPVLTSRGTRCRMGSVILQLPRPYDGDPPFLPNTAGKIWA
jgi:ABC-type glycerol-3-phosphate transport system permease component